MLLLQCWKNKFLCALSLLFLLSFINQTSLFAQSKGSAALYTSYLPFMSAYNSLTTNNSVTNYESTTSDFKFAAGDILHYAPGFALSGVYAVQGILTSIDLGIMGGPGANNIIPDIPVRPFIAINVAGKFVNTPILGAYITGGAYADIAFAKGKNNYSFGHFLGFLRFGPGVSLKASLVEFFAQVQIGIGLQMEEITLESKAGNPIYEATYTMVPVGIFPEAGIRIWL